jgi:hypothetical protein
MPRRSKNLAISACAKSDSVRAMCYDLPVSVRSYDRSGGVRYECVFSAKGIVGFILGLGRL